MAEPRTGKPGRPLMERPSGPGTALANFLIEELAAADLTAEEIARKLGYARPNIVSAWKTARSKFTLDNLWALSELLNVEPAYMLALYIDQYVSASDGVDHFDDIFRMMSRIVSDEEWAIIETVREARRHNVLPMNNKQRDAVRSIFEVPITTPVGPYKPLPNITPSPAGARRKFARRGHQRDMSVDEIEEMTARKEVKPPRAVRKKSVAAKEAEPA